MRDQEDADASGITEAKTVWRILSPSRVVGVCPGVGGTEVSGYLRTSRQVPWAREVSDFLDRADGFQRAVWSSGTWVFNTTRIMRDRSWSAAQRGLVVARRGAPMTRFYRGARYYLFDPLGRPLPASARPTRVRERVQGRDHQCRDHLGIARVVRCGCLPQVVMKTSGLALVERHTMGLHTIHFSLLSGGDDAQMYTVNKSIL